MDKKVIVTIAITLLLTLPLANATSSCVTFLPNDAPGKEMGYMDASVLDGYMEDVIMMVADEDSDGDYEIGEELAIQPTVPHPSSGQQVMVQNLLVRIYKNGALVFYEYTDEDFGIVSYEIPAYGSFEIVAGDAKFDFIPEFEFDGETEEEESAEELTEIETTLPENPLEDSQEQAEEATESAAGVDTAEIESGEQDALNDTLPATIETSAGNPFTLDEGTILYIGIALVIIAAIVAIYFVLFSGRGKKKGLSGIKYRDKRRRGHSYATGI